MLDDLHDNRDISPTMKQCHGDDDTSMLCVVLMLTMVCVNAFTKLLVILLLPLYSNTLNIVLDVMALACL